MKRSEIMPAIEKAIEERTPPHESWYWLCWSANQIKCTPGGFVNPPEVWFAKLTEKQIFLGLTAKEWQSVENRVMSFLQQKGKLCQK